MTRPAAALASLLLGLALAVAILATFAAVRDVHAAGVPSGAPAADLASARP
jgi:hypothetical protein